VRIAARGATLDRAEGWLDPAAEWERRFDRSAAISKLANGRGEDESRLTPSRRARRVHGERTFRRPAQVFKAFTDERAKSRWFAGGGDDPKLSSARWTCVRRTQVRGRQWKSGKIALRRFYFDVVRPVVAVYALRDLDSFLYSRRFRSRALSCYFLVTDRKHPR